VYRYVNVGLCRLNAQLSCTNGSFSRHAKIVRPLLASPSLCAFAKEFMIVVCILIRGSISFALKSCLFILCYTLFAGRHSLAYIVCQPWCTDGRLGLVIVSSNGDN
jgi:hypothetical protein